MNVRLRSRSSSGGFTLIEIMVAFAIIALVAAASLKGFRSLTRADLRSSTVKLSGAIKYLFDRASTTGKHHRLVLDLNEGRYWAEVSDDRFYIPRDAESLQEARRREEKEAGEDEEAVRRREEAAGSGLSATSSYDPSKLEMGDFRPKRARFAAFKETALKPMALKNAQILSVYTPRLADAVTTGRAYIYFFPMGQTEPAIVTLSDPSGETRYSLVVHPLTGRVHIYDKEVPPPVGQQQYDDEGNRVAPP
jgi:general secretion pathway protein H